MLLATRFPCLSGEQRRVVLKTTAWASGYPVMDDAEGWGRLDLFAAADGYGAFEGDVNLVLDAAKGGFCESDLFRNDIEGDGRLNKAGSGALWLGGDNSYTGGTVLVEGTLGALSPTALGAGDVYVRGGTLHNASQEDLELPGAYTQLAGELTLELSQQLKGGLLVDGTAVIAGGTLRLRFSQGVPSAGVVIDVLRAHEIHGHFDQITVEGASEIEVMYSDSGVAVRLKQVP